MLWLAGATNPKTKTSGLPVPHKSCKSKGMVAGTPVAGQATYQGHLLGSYSTPTSWTPKWQTFRTVFSLCKVPSLVLFHVSGYWTSRGMFWLNLFWKPWHRECKMRGCTCSMNPSGQALLGTPKHLLSRGIMANCTKSMTEIFQKNQSKIPVTIPCCSTMFQNCRQPVLQKLNCLCSFFAHIIHVSFQTLPMRSRSYCKPP